jgi:hypothetical protein
MYEIYWPKKFCREFVSARGHSVGLSALMAVVSGHKPCVDVWVKPSDLPSFLKAVRRYGLIAQKDIAFQMASRQTLSPDIVGKDRLSTTIAYGFNSKPPGRGKYHVFVAKSKEALTKAFALGWYPVIVGNRVIDRPLADGFKFGEALGYPECCCEFFRQKNNWLRFNFLDEIYRRTKGKLSYLCNPLGRDSTYTYISHMPCSFNCKETHKKAASFREFLIAEESQFAQRIDAHLQLPYLAFFERKIYAFDGQVKGNSIVYKSAYFVGLNEDFNPYLGRLSKANELRLEGNNVILLKNGQQKDIIKNEASNVPGEAPFIVQCKG